MLSAHSARAFLVEARLLLAAARSRAPACRRALSVGPSAGGSGGEGGEAGAAKGAAGGGAGVPPPPPPPLIYRLKEDMKDILSVVFGWERKRNLEEEYDMGLRAYPWITYAGPDGAPMYRNTETGATTGIKPLDFDRRASATSFRATNTEASAVMVAALQVSPWERTLKALGSTPLIRSLLAVGDAVAQGPVGQSAAKVKVRVSEIKEDLQEKWETSQHPFVFHSRLCGGFFGMVAAAHYHPPLITTPVTHHPPPPPPTSPPPLFQSYCECRLCSRFCDVRVGAGARY
jgi:hypothetical protein